MEYVADSVERLDRFLSRQLPDWSRTKLAGVIACQDVLVNGEPRKPSFRLEPGMVVSVIALDPTPPHDLTPVDMDLDLIFEDEVMLVLNKPRGVATHPAPGLREPTLVNALLARSISLSSGSAEYRPGIVHRLDKETTGLIVIAKTDAAHARLAQQMAQKTAERRYVGLCRGLFPTARLKIEAPIARDQRDRRKMTIDAHGKDAVTHLKRLAEIEGNTLFAARLETGRTHQIRVHLSAAGHDIIGDSIYARGPWAEGPLQLHAGYLGLCHPITAEDMAFTVAPPKDFRHADLLDVATLTEW